MNFLPQDTIVITIDEDGNTLQELLTSDKVNFETGISVSGDLNIYTPSGEDYTLLVNDQPVFQVSPAGNITFNNNVLLDIGEPVSGTSAVNKDYVDNEIYTLSGSTKTYVDNQDLVFSGALQSNIDNKVYKTGDTMTGILTLSSDPVSNLHAATKQYVDNQLVSGTHQIFSYVFTAATNYYTSVNSSTLTVVGHMIFRGSSIVGAPTNIKAILGHTSTGVQFQIYDYTNSNIICDVTTASGGPILIDCGTISNIPTEIAIWQFKLRRTGSNGQGRIYALDIRV